MSNIHYELNKLQSNYLISMREKHAEIITCWLNAEQHQWTNEMTLQLKVLVKHLADTALIYGFNDIVVASQKIEQALNKLNHQNNQTELQHHLQSLCSLLIIYAQHYLNMPVISPVASPPTVQTIKYTILWIDKLNPNLEKLIQQLSSDNFEVTLYSDLSKHPHYDLKKSPDIILFDDIHADNLVQLKPWLLQHYPLVPKLFISEYCHLACRLQAIETGALYFLAKPLMFPQLLKTLHDIIMVIQAIPYKILFLLATPHSFAVQRSALQQMGWQLLVTHDLHSLQEALISFKPDFLIIENELPQQRGESIITLIRQENTYPSLPIALIVEQETPALRLLAIQSGANEIIAAQVDTHYLFKLIQIYIENAYQYHKLIAYDGLTGLLNRRYFEQQLNAFLASAERSGNPVAVALFDIDHFKIVNQRYGYLTGNAILKNITRLLKQRLRRGDLIGRYEEDCFVIALNEVDFITAESVLKEIANEIMKNTYKAENIEVKITLSVGAAHYPGYALSLNTQNIVSLIMHTAERALITAQSQQAGVLLNELLDSD